MINIKKGQVLKGKDGGGESKVLAVLEETALISRNEDFDSVSCWLTFKELEEDFEIPEEKWVPTKGKSYWFFSSEQAESLQWVNSLLDQKRLAIGNAFPTRKACEKWMKEKGLMVE